MNEKILFVILTCNRQWYCRNCYFSMRKCVDMDRADILICDNNTVEEGFDEFLHEEAKKDNVEVKKFDDRNRNELYRAMNYAIQYAQKNKYKIINFVQDDFQYIYRRDNHLDEVIDILNNRKDIVQVNCNMGWKRKAKGLGKIEDFKSLGTRYGILKDKRSCDNGFTRVDIYDKIGLYPGEAVSWGNGPNRYKDKLNGEIWFGRECKERKLYRCLSYMPNIGMMMDCSYVRGNRRYGYYSSPPNDFYLKMLDDNQIKQIRKNHDAGKFSFVEDFCIPDGWEPRTYNKHTPIRNPQKVDWTKD